MVLASAVLLAPSASAYTLSGGQPVSVDIVKPKNTTYSGNDLKVEANIGTGSGYSVDSVERILDGSSRDVTGDYDSSASPELQFTEVFSDGRHKLVVEATASNSDGDSATASDEVVFCITGSGDCTDSPPPEESEVLYGNRTSELGRCINGRDDDSDLAEDVDDSGCSKPYWRDRMEANLFDLDASYLFAGDSAPDSSGPSAREGSSAYRSQRRASSDPDAKDSSTGITDFWIVSDPERADGESPPL